MKGDRRALARAISILEEGGEEAEEVLELLPEKAKAFVVGVTGPPGSGKSTLIGALAEELASRGHRIGILAIDPSSRLTGGAVLGDRLRMMSAAVRENVYIRSLAARGGRSVSKSAKWAVRALAASGRDLVFVETVGVGQQDYEALEVADLIILVLGAGSGDEIQSLKAGLIELADVIVVNKADKPEAAALISGLNIAFQGKPRKPRILVVSALRGTGVKELAEVVEKVRGDKVRRDPRILRTVLVENVLEAVRARLEEMQELDEAAERAASGETSVEEEVKRILQKMIK